MKKMKTILLAATALGMMGGMAWAGGNNSDLIQAGQDGEATISQSGNSNDSFLRQDAPTTENKATITQTGNLGEVGLKQQAGTGNEAAITQGGLNNWVGDKNVDVAGQGPLTQSGNANELTINQAGAYNDINQGIQEGNGNYLNIVQDGGDGSVAAVNNSIEFEQVGPTSGGSGNGSRDTGPALRNAYDPFEGTDYAAISSKWGFIEQHNTGNTLSLYQNAEGTGAVGNGVIARQLGTDGTLSLDQSGGANFAYLQQQGSSQTIIVDQDNEGADLVENYNLVDIRQGVSGNTADVTQYGQRQDAYIDQQGASNSMAVTLQGALSFGNTVAVVQTGDGQYSWTSQLGNENVALVTQGGMDHESLLEQSGDLNFASIDQSGNDHYSNLVQSGDSNSFTLVQSGTTMSNTSTATQSGTGNVANVTQN